MNPTPYEKVKNIKKRLFHNAFWLFGGKTASSVFSAIQAIIVARILGVSDYGLLVLVIAYVDILNNFFDFRVWETAIKYIGTFWANGEGEKTRSMIKLSYIIDVSSGFLALAVAVVTAKVASVYVIHSPEAAYFISIYAFSLLIDTANSTSDAILRVFDKFKSIAFISSLFSFFRLALVSIVLLLVMGIEGVLFAHVLSSFLGFAVRVWAVSKTLKDNGLQGWQRANLGLIKDQWKGIAWFLGNTSLAGTIKLATDNYLGILALGYFSGKEAAAYYKVAKSSIKIMNSITLPLHQAMYPELVKVLNSGAVKNLKKLAKYATKSLMKFTVPVAVMALIFSGPIISLIFGEEYLPASNALRVVTVAALVLQLTFWISSALLAFGRPGLRTLVGLISTALYVVLLFLLVPKFSHIGAAFAFLGHSVVRTSALLFSFRSCIRSERKLLEA